MESGEGLIVRVRPRCGAFSLDEARVLARVSRLYGNGHLDLTRRANLQLRGVSAATIPHLIDVLGTAGLLDADASAEAIRNVMVNPLAGLDPDEYYDMRPLARALTQKLAMDVQLQALSHKFGFILDGGGVLPLVDERADIRLTAVPEPQGFVIALGLDGARSTVWLGGTSPDRAPDAALQIAYDVLMILRQSSSPSGPRSRRGRVRHLQEAELAESVGRLSARLDPIPGARPWSMLQGCAKPPPRKPRKIGILDFGDQGGVVGIGAPFGRIEAEQLEQLCGALSAAGSRELRLSPWRVLYAPVSDARAARPVLDAAHTLGLVTDPDDPLLRVEACPGAPVCPAAAADTRVAARRIADALSRLKHESAEFGGANPHGERDILIHISGCAKGCACSTPADLVLVAEPYGFAVISNGTAADRATNHIAATDLMADPAAVLAMLGEHRHG